MSTTQPPPESSESPQPPPLTPEQASEIATTFVLAMMASASTSKIRPTDWWERARTALEYSARSSHSPRQMVTLFARKISAETLTGATTERLSCLSSLDAPGAFATFRRTVERESTYIVAFAQARRAEERAEAGEIKAALAPTEARLADALDENRRLKAELDRAKSRANDESENARVLALRVRALESTTTTPATTKTTP